eukprot:scaffold36298_cov122-Isochrysis_galbana.AAC.12
MKAPQRLRQRDVVHSVAQPHAEAAGEADRCRRQLAASDETREQARHITHPVLFRAGLVEALHQLAAARKISLQAIRLLACERAPPHRARGAAPPAGTEAQPPPPAAQAHWPRPLRRCSAVLPLASAHPLAPAGWP